MVKCWPIYQIIYATHTNIIAWLGVTKCSWSAITWVLNDLEESFLAHIADSLYELDYKQWKEKNSDKRYATCTTACFLLRHKITLYIRSEGISHSCSFDKDPRIKTSCLWLINSYILLSSEFRHIKYSMHNVLAQSTNINDLHTLPYSALKDLLTQLPHFLRHVSRLSPARPAHSYFELHLGGAGLSSTE